MIQSSVTLGCAVTALALAVAASGCGTNGSGTDHSFKHAHAAAPPLLGNQARSDIQFGWIRSMTPFGHGYRVRFDLGIILGGRTGVLACVDNGQCPADMRASGGFLDDITSGDLKFVLTYYLSPNARVALDYGNGFIPCTARELYLLYRGKDPRRLREKTGVGSKLVVFGWWIKLTRGSYPPKAPLESIVRVEQQYHP